MSYSAFKLIAPGSDGKSIRNTITFEGHTFSPGDVVRYYVPTGGDGGNGWTGAIATSSLEAEVAGVVESTTDNTFTVVYGGEISTTLFPNASSFSENDVYFLSDTDAAKLTSTPPIEGGHVIKPVLTVVDSNTAIVTNYIGTAIGGRATVSLDSVQPVGTIMSYAGNPESLPSSWELCDGSYLDINEYSELYGKIGTTFGRKQKIVTSVGVQEGGGIDEEPGIAVGGGDPPIESGTFSISVGHLVSQEIEGFSDPITGVVDSVDADNQSFTVRVDHLSLDADGNETPNNNLFVPGSITITNPAGQGESLTATSATIVEFAKPNLSARFALGSSGDVYPLGEQGGIEEVILSVDDLPPDIRAFSGTFNYQEGSDESGLGFSGPGGGEAHQNMPPFLTLHYIIRVNSYAKASYIDGLDLDLSMGGLSDTEDVVYGTGQILIYDGSSNGGEWRPYTMFQGYSADTGAAVSILYSFPGAQTSLGTQFYKASAADNPEKDDLLLDGITIDIPRGQLQVGRSWINEWTQGYIQDYTNYLAQTETSVVSVVGDLVMNGRDALGPARICSFHRDGIWGTTLDYSGAVQYYFGEGAFNGQAEFGVVNQNDARLTPAPPNQIDLNYQCGYFLGVDPSFTEYSVDANTSNRTPGYYNAILISSLQGVHICVDHNDCKSYPGEQQTPGFEDAIFTVGMGGFGYGPLGPNTGGYINHRGEQRANYSELFRIEGDTGRAGFFGFDCSTFPGVIGTNIGVGISGGLVMNTSTHSMNDFVQDGVSSTSYSDDQKNDVPSLYAVNEGLNQYDASIRSYIDTSITNATNSFSNDTISDSEIIQVELPQNQDGITITGKTPGKYFLTIEDEIFGDGTFRINGVQKGVGYQTSGGGTERISISFIVTIQNDGILVIDKWTVQSGWGALFARNARVTGYRIGA